MNTLPSVEQSITELRHAIHRRPEIGLELPETQRLIIEALDGLPLEITTGKALNSVVAVLRGAQPGPTVLLRADMDALPVTERTELPFASEIDGVMHACGHDTHVAMLVGAAKLLSERREQIHGSVVFMFQPGEEGWWGARLMIEEGVLGAAGAAVEAAYGMHVYSGLLPAGTFATRIGAQTSASARLKVRVIGRGGHGSRPHLSADPVPAACEMVLAMQSALTRSIDVFDPAVITVGHFQAGTKRNVIPDVAEFDATIRSYSPAAADKIEEVSTRVCRGIAEAHGLEIELEYYREYPAMIGTQESYEVIKDVVTELFGAERFVELEHPMYGSEDFAFVLEQVRGNFIVLGACPPENDLASAPTNHSATVEFDDRVLIDGAQVYAGVALRHLGATAE